MTRRVAHRIEAFLKQCEDEGVALRKKLPELNTVRTNLNNNTRSPSPPRVTQQQQQQRITPTPLSTTAHAKRRAESPLQQPPSHHGPIHTFNSAVESAFSMMPSEWSLDDKWSCLTRWVRKYTHDQTANRLAVLAERLATELAAKTKTMPNPCLLRTAAACVLMEQVMHLISESMPTLVNVTRTAFTEVLQSIYPNCPDLPEDGFSYVERPEDSHVVQSQISRFNAKTYFTVCRSMSQQSQQNLAQMESQIRGKNKQMSVVNRTVEHWQRYTLLRLLRGWRGHVARERTARAAAATEQKNTEALAEARKTITDLQLKVSGLERDLGDVMARQKEVIEQYKTQVVGLEQQVHLLQTELDAALMSVTIQPEELMRMRTSLRDLSIFRDSALREAELWPLSERLTSSLDGLKLPENRSDFLYTWAQHLTDHALLEVSVSLSPLDPYLKVSHILEPNIYNIAMLKRDLLESDPKLKALSLLGTAKGKIPFVSSLLVAEDLIGTVEECRAAYITLSLGYLVAFSDRSATLSFLNQYVVDPSDGNEDLHLYNKRRAKQANQRSYVVVAMEQFCKELLSAGDG